MSDTRHDGGPAFPVIKELVPDYYDEDARRSGDRPTCYQAESSDGMSIRDYFAAKALSGIVFAMNSEDRRRYREGHAEGHEARVAYAIADAMLAERAK